MGSLLDLWDKFKMEQKGEERYLSTGCNEMDDLLVGGIPLDAPSMFYGKFDIGKSLLSMQVACMCTRPEKVLRKLKVGVGDSAVDQTVYEGLGKKAIIIDTESFWKPSLKAEWTGYFKQRWPDVDPEKVEIFQVSNIFDFARLLGMDYSLAQSEKKVDVIVHFPKMEYETKEGKMIVRTLKAGETQKESMISHDWMTKTPIYEKLKDKEYGVVIVDSQTKLIKSFIGSGMQNLGARGGAQRPILALYVDLCKLLGIGIISTHHGVFNPIGGTTDPWGGGDLPFYIKAILGITLANSDLRTKYGPQCRQVIRYRRAGKLSYVPPQPVSLKLNYGYTSPEPIVLTAGPGRVGSAKIAQPIPTFQGKVEP
jgi:hypothetical protein